MAKLKKVEFNEQFRFRKPRRDLHHKASINCSSCANSYEEEVQRNRRGKLVQEGGQIIKEDYCTHDQRVKRVRLMSPRFLGDSSSTADSSLCDAYTSRLLPEGVKIPTLPKGQMIVLESQFRDIWHADPECPYVL
jgi:hypothetical protein